MSKKVREIIGADFFDTPIKLGNGFDCISVVGKPVGRYEKYVPYLVIPKITLSQPLKDMMYKNKDYSEVFKKYIALLEKKKATILEEIENCGDRICLMDDAYGERGFRLRYIFAYWLEQQGYELSSTLKSQVDSQYAMWHTDIYKDRGHHNLTNKFCKEYLESLNWKTSRDGSHQYVMREWLDPADWELFMQVGTHTRYFGDKCEFYGITYRQLQLGDYFYWTMGGDFLNTDISIINRKRNV